MGKQCVKNAIESVSSVDSDVIISYRKNTQVVALICNRRLSSQGRQFDVFPAKFEKFGVLV